MKNFITLLVSCTPLLALCQTTSIDDAYKKIDSLNQITVKSDNMIVSYQGLNKYIGTKVASYLTTGGDLSLFKNYAVLNTDDGTFSINHNFSKPDKIGAIHNLWTIGVKASLADQFATIVSDKSLSDELGISFKYTYLGRGIVFHNKPEQKKIMNSKRASLLSSLHCQMFKEEADTLVVIDNLEAKNIPGDSLETIRPVMKSGFYKNLGRRYMKEFSDEEANTLDDGGDNVNEVTSNWCSFSAFIPVTPTKYSVAQTYATNFSDQQLYPWEFDLSFNKFWEFQRTGKFFLYIYGGVFQNNSANTDAMEKVDYNTYKKSGGVDSLYNAVQTDSKTAYIGSYSKFITPLFKFQFVYFPADWEVGLSIYGEQNFGSYNATNAKIGVPIHLQGAESDKQVNFELQLKFSDLRNTVMPDKTFKDKLSFGVSVAVPFSSMIY